MIWTMPSQSGGCAFFKGLKLTLPWRAVLGIEGLMVILFIPLQAPYRMVAQKLESTYSAYHKESKKSQDFSHDSATKHDVKRPYAFLDSACIFVSCCKFLARHVIYLRFWTTASNKRLN